MAFERMRAEPYKIVFQEQDTIQLRTRDGKTLTFGISSDSSRYWIVESAEKDGLVGRYIGRKLIPIMFIPSAELPDTGEKHADDGLPTQQTLEYLANLAGVSPKEFEKAARFAQRKLYEGFRQRAQQRKKR